MQKNVQNVVIIDGQAIWKSQRYVTLTEFDERVSDMIMWLCRQ